MKKNLPLNYNKLSIWSAEEDFPDSTNRYIEKILKKHSVKTVLDLSCGTGSQVFWLAKHGYEVIGVDISVGMLKIARSNAKKEKIEVELLEGDMRTTKVGSFDAVITIFNAIGHLTKTDFEKAIRNIHANLKDGGLYIFDIFNLDCRKNDTMAMDVTKKIGETKIRKVQKSKLNRKNGVLSSNDCFYVQTGSGKTKIYKGKFSLQLYGAKEIENMLTRNGFKVLGQYGIDGAILLERKTVSIMTIAKKQTPANHSVEPIA